MKCVVLYLKHRMTTTELAAKSSSTWFFDLIFGYKSSVRNLLCGLNDIHMNVVSYVQNMEPIPFHMLYFFFDCYDYQLLIGECKLHHMHNVQVIIVHPKNSDIYIIHPIKLHVNNNMSDSYSIKNIHYVCNTLPDKLKPYTNKIMWIVQKKSFIRISNVYNYKHTTKHL